MMNLDNLPSLIGTGRLAARMANQDEATRRVTAFPDYRTLVVRCLDHGYVPTIRLNTVEACYLACSMRRDGLRLFATRDQ